MTRVLVLALMVIGCGGSEVEPNREWRHYAERLGDPVSGLDEETLASYWRGAEVVARDFTPESGLGPSFNADSCASCHGVPVPGGAAPRYRDFFLVKKARFDGTPINAGTNGISPVRNLYAFEGGHLIAPPESDTLVTAARRNAPPMFGVGLFEFVSDQHILSREDPNDDDGDGISGVANFEQGRVGKFGYKSQASNLESFNRGAMLNQMGLTSNPLFEEFPDKPLQSAWLEMPSHNPFALPTAWAQVSAPGEPTTDDDGVPDPEMSDQDQRDLLIFSTYIAPPKPAESDRRTRAGARQFEKLGCATCHVPSLESRIGPIPAYSDLLLHELGEENADGLSVSFAGPSEFRTAPLWGVALTAPYLHDGRADTLEEAILAHGGEGAASRDRYVALREQGQQDVLQFLESLGPYVDHRPGLLGPDSALPEEASQPGPDDVGVPGGPRRVLTESERDLWLLGRELFDRNMLVEEGLGSSFNADSCRACHQDPVLGGAGGIDTSVLRIAEDTELGPVNLDHLALPRVVLPGDEIVRMVDVPLVTEARQPLSVLGAGVIGEISEAAILANADPGDMDGDGISGVARDLDGSLGRYGWKAQIGSIEDFAADALLQELGATLPSSFSPFTAPDDDGVADPEVSVSDANALSFYMRQLSPDQGDASAAQLPGAAVFEQVGCGSCHVAELDGVRLYSDLLLHDVGDPFAPAVDQEIGDVELTEYRTPPLWGVSNTSPYLHDGSAFTLDEAILGHFGEAAASRDAWDALSESEKASLREFLESL